MVGPGNMQVEKSTVYRPGVMVMLLGALIGYSVRSVAGQDTTDRDVRPAPALPAAVSGERDSKSGGLGFWSIAGMMDQACRNVSKRYNLNPEQEKYTRALMARNLKSFLADHETELRSLLMDRFINQAAGQANPANAQRWADRAKPIFDAARKTINSGNQEWREILDEEQKRIQDTDMAAMQVTFRQLDERFGRWKRGDYNPERDRFASRPASSGAGGAGVHRNRTNLRNLSRVVGKKPYRRKSEAHWDAYVRRFIENHKLGESQQHSALAILSDCKERAVNYRQAHADDLTKAESKMREAAATGTDRTARALAQKRLSEVNKPIRELFNELRARLDAIPTEAQKQARAKTIQAQREKYMAKMRKQREARIAKKRQASSQPASAPATAAPSSDKSADKPAKKN